MESDLDLLAELVELDDFPCCDANHPHGVSFHDPSAPAEFLIVSPCCGDRGLLCRARSQYLRNVVSAERRGDHPLHAVRPALASRTVPFRPAAPRVPSAVSDEP
ncbi:hypothetical protein [Leifsonia sp. Leaf336]|uniref:hypothetical protein n=1 Tax=Leifsonia sp. Leaf336 TaxID=1736341 RepID=UPI0012FBE20F|nr:hypothetical protein [Leifsonia sp. Leaf336]